MELTLMITTAMQYLMNQDVNADLKFEWLFLLAFTKKKKKRKIMTFLKQIFFD